MLRYHVGRTGGVAAVAVHRLDGDGIVVVGDGDVLDEDVDARRVDAIGVEREDGDAVVGESAAREEDLALDVDVHRYVDVPHDEIPHVVEVQVVHGRVQEPQFLDEDVGALIHDDHVWSVVDGGEDDVPPPFVSKPVEETRALDVDEGRVAHVKGCEGSSASVRGGPCADVVRHEQGSVNDEGDVVDSRDHDVEDVVFAAARHEHDSVVGSAWRAVVGALERLLNGSRVRPGGIVARIAGHRSVVVDGKDVSRCQPKEEHQEQREESHQDHQRRRRRRRRRSHLFRSREHSHTHSLCRCFDSKRTLSNQFLVKHSPFNNIFLGGGNISIVFSLVFVFGFLTN